MIESSQISVVVQGPVIRDTPGEARKSATTASVLHSIRRFLPEAEIILSTWQGEDLAGLDCDRWVTSEDPGASGDRNVTSSANILRQIRSSTEGLRIASRTYALKLRTDTALISSSFTQIWEAHESSGMKPFCFKKRILVSAIFTPHPKNCPSPYWVSDFFAFGLIEDIRNLWEIPFEVIQKRFEADQLNPRFSQAHAINAEQRLILAMAAKNGVSECVRNITSVDPLLLMRSERFIASHFLPTDPALAGFELAERFHRFKGHHTYRVGYDGPLFRASSPSYAYFVWLCGFARIAVASIKGLCGRGIRLARQQARP